MCTLIIQYPWQGLNLAMPPTCWRPRIPNPSKLQSHQTPYSFQEWTLPSFKLYWYVYKQLELILRKINWYAYNYNQNNSFNIRHFVSGSKVFNPVCTYEVWWPWRLLEGFKVSTDHNQQAWHVRMTNSEHHINLKLQTVFKPVIVKFSILPSSHTSSYSGGKYSSMTLCQVPNFLFSLI